MPVFSESLRGITGKAMVFYSNFVLLETWVKNSNGKRTPSLLFSNDGVLVFYAEILNYTL